jgi:predicted O-methyltransferase YrrM
MDWTGDYIADIGYTANFYRETAPSHMAFTTLCIGRSPGRAFKPKRMLELGFGQGFGLTLLAAANPDIAFEGYDFNPEHVAHARRLTQGGGPFEHTPVRDRLRGCRGARWRQRR